MISDTLEVSISIIYNTAIRTAFSEIGAALFTLSLFRVNDFTNILLKSVTEFLGLLALYLESTITNRIRKIFTLTIIQAFCLYTIDSV